MTLAGCTCWAMLFLERKRRCRPNRRPRPSFFLPHFSFISLDDVTAADSFLHTAPPAGDTVGVSSLISRYFFRRLLVLAILSKPLAEEILCSPLSFVPCSTSSLGSRMTTLFSCSICSLGSHIPKSFLDASPLDFSSPSRPALLSLHSRYWGDRLHSSSSMQVWIESDEGEGSTRVCEKLRSSNAAAVILNEIDRGGLFAGINLWPDIAIDFSGM